jgi:hypothetical protein
MKRAIWSWSLSMMGIFFLSGIFLTARANGLQFASVYVDAGRFTEAVALFKNYPARNEDVPAINLLAGKTYLAIDKPAKAVEFFEMADALTLDNLEAQLDLPYVNSSLVSSQWQCDLPIRFLELVNNRPNPFISVL